MNVDPVHVLVGGIALLILLLHDRARFVAAMMVLVVVLVAAAQVFSVNLQFGK